MTNRNLLLGRSTPSEKPTRAEIAALDQVTAPPAPPAKPSGKKGGGPQRTVRRDLLKFRWSLECPGCGFKVTGDGPAPARAAPGEVRPLQAGPGPGRRMMVRQSSILSTRPGVKVD